MKATSLFIKNLHDEVTENMLVQKFQVVGKVSVDIRKNDNCTNAFVYFDNHDDADHVKKSMNNDILKGKPMQISWNVRDPAIQQAKQANLIIRNLDKSVDVKRLTKEFESFGTIVSIKIPTDENGSKGYAYVNYETELQAKEAICQLNGRKIGRKKIIVEKFIPSSERGNQQNRASSLDCRRVSDTDRKKQDFERHRKYASSSNFGNISGSPSCSKINNQSRHSSVSLPVRENDYFLSDERKVFMDGQRQEFVEKSPTIIDEKLRYLQSMLCGKYKQFCNKKINKTFDCNHAKGRLAAVNDKVILVTTTEASHIECCKLLDDMIQCDSIDVPKTLVGSKITSTSVALKIKEEKLKYLALCLDEADCTVQIASFNKPDIEKGKRVVQDFIQSFLCVKIFKCDQKVADFILKHYSFDLPQVSEVSSGVKIMGEELEVQMGIYQLEQEQFLMDKVEFQAAKLSYYFLTSQKWATDRDDLEKRYKCSIATNQSKVVPQNTNHSFLTSTSLPKVQYRVRQGDISDENSDAIVIGVSGNFDLSWGKIAPIVAKKAGVKLQRRCSSNPLVSTDCLRVTKGYDLPCKYVFHLITPNTAQELTHRVKIVLDEAKKLGITSISFPTLGAGAIGIEPQEVALAMCKAFEEFTKGSQLGSNSLKTINIIVFENVLVPVFQQFALPSDDTSSVENSSTQNFSSVEEEWRITVTSLSRKSNDEVVEKLKQMKKKVIVTEELVDDKLDKFEENEYYEIEKAVKEFGARVEIKKSSKVAITGLAENVARVKKKIQFLLNDLAEAMVVAKACVWKMESSSGTFEPFPLRVSRILSTNYEKSPTSRFKICMRGSTFQIDFAQMAYISSLLKTGKIKREVANNLDANLPCEWSPMNGELMKRVVLSPDSTEYKDVLNLFNKSRPNFSSVQKIERIQNPELYHGYEVKKREVEKHMPKDKPASRKLFHGTSRDDVDAICSHGFDRGFAGKNASLYGRGVYFAVNSSYSVGYCDRSGWKSMFLALVLTGNFCKGEKEHKCPPPMGFGKAFRRHDSVVDDVSSPTLFVVFNDASVYPNYLITFQ